MDIKIEVITCSDPKLNCAYNPDHKSICPAQDMNVICNEARLETITVNCKIKN